LGSSLEGQDVSQRASRSGLLSKGTAGSFRGTLKKGDVETTIVRSFSSAKAVRKRWKIYTKSSKTGKGSF